MEYMPTLTPETTPTDRHIRQSQTRRVCLVTLPLRPSSRNSSHLRAKSKSEKSPKSEKQGHPDGPRIPRMDRRTDGLDRPVRGGKGVGWGLGGARGFAWKPYVCWSSVFNGFGKGFECCRSWVFELRVCRTPETEGQGGKRNTKITKKSWEFL